MPGTARSRVRAEPDREQDGPTHQTGNNQAPQDHESYIGTHARVSALEKEARAEAREVPEKGTARRKS